MPRYAGDDVSHKAGKQGGHDGFSLSPPWPLQRSRKCNLPMIPFTYRCPQTGQQVQGWAADDLTEGETYEPVTCTACGRIHLVNPKSGKVLESAKK